MPHLHNNSFHSIYTKLYTASHCTVKTTNWTKNKLTFWKTILPFKSLCIQHLKTIFLGNLYHMSFEMSIFPQRLTSPFIKKNIYNYCTCNHSPSILDGLKTAALFGDKRNVPSAELNTHRIPVLEKKKTTLGACIMCHKY